MAQLFPPYSNMLLRVGLASVVLLVAGAGVVFGAGLWSTYGTRMDAPREQPVPFSHEHHVGGLGLDCRYCHTTVETSRSAGYPSTRTCMNCHSYVWKDAPMLEPVRRSWRERKPIQWTRVYDLPDFVFFDHSMHVAKGVGCETCHGRVDRMPITYQKPTLYMKWCIGCHEAPEKHLRPRSEIYTMGYEPAEPQSVLGPRLAEEYHVRKDLTECYVCHR